MSAQYHLHSHERSDIPHHTNINILMQLVHGAQPFQVHLLLLMHSIPFSSCSFHYLLPPNLSLSRYSLPVPHYNKSMASLQTASSCVPPGFPMGLLPHNISSLCPWEHETHPFLLCGQNTVVYSGIEMLKASCNPTICKSLRCLYYPFK